MGYKYKYKSTIWGGIYMSFIPGLIIGVLITLYREDIFSWVKGSGNKFKNKTWLKSYYYVYFKYRIINKNDVSKSTLVSCHEKDLLSQKQYEELFKIYKGMRRLRLINPYNQEEKTKQNSISMG